MVTTESYEQIAENLGELHSRLRNFQNQMLREMDISLSEFHILIFLNHRESVSQNELAEAMNVDKALISRQTQTMVAKNLIQCRIDPSCHRRKLLTLGEQAYEILPQLQKIHECSLERLFSSVDERQLVTLKDILKGIIENT
jgi:Transcriptional regulators